MSRFAIAALVVCFGAGAARAAVNPAFSYFVKSSEQGYVMSIEMAFSRGVSLGRVVAAVHEPQLIHELFEGSLPDQTDQIDPGGATYARITAVRTLGVTTRMYFRCRESVGPDGRQEWRRHCELDPQKLDGGKVMERKSDDLSCRLRPDGRVGCLFDARGKLKDYFFIPAARLTVKAKTQALVNWGRFWAFLEEGALSARLSNASFDGSEIARNLEQVEANGLIAAEKKPFEFQAMARFEGRQGQEAH